MENQNHESFKSMVAASAPLKARWLTVSESVMATAERMGVRIERTDVLNCPSARISVLANQEIDPDDLAADLARLPQFIAETRKQEVRAALAKGDTPEEFRNLTAQQRINKSRELGLNAPPVKAKPERMTPDQESAWLKKLLTRSRADRLSLARAQGFVK